MATLATAADFWAANLGRLWRPVPMTLAVEMTGSISGWPSASASLASFGTDSFYKRACVAIGVAAISQPGDTTYTAMIAGASMPTPEERQTAANDTNYTNGTAPGRVPFWRPDVLEIVLAGDSDDATAYAAEVLGWALHAEGQRHNWQHLALTTEVLTELDGGTHGPCFRALTWAAR